ncbi:MAG TPA: ABC transporter ATP-binding protein [Rudaea sp.]
MTAPPRQAELRTPSWRLDEAAQTTSLRAVARRIASAVRPVVSILRRAAPLSALVVVVAQVAAGFVTTASLLLTTRVLDALFAGTPNAERLRAALPALLLLGGVFALRLVLDAGAATARAHLAPKLRRVAEEDLYRASLAVDLDAFDDPVFYDQLHRAHDRGVMHLENAANGLAQACGALCTLLACAAALLVLHPLLLAVFFVSLLPEGWAALVGARIHYVGMPTTVALTRQALMMAELAVRRDAAAEIRVNQAQDYVLAEFHRHASALQDHLVDLGRRAARMATLGRALSSVGLIVVFAALGAMLQARKLDLAVAGTAVLAIRSAGAALAQLMQIANDLFQKALYIGDYRDFIERSQTRRRAAGGLDAPQTPGRIELDGVSFRYAGAGERLALHDISLAIEQGQTIALVGENGSGKTTLAKLIAGLYRPSEGRITWNGTDVHAIAPQSLADRVVMVPQEPIRWPRSARDNVRLGRYTRDDPEDAALFEAALLSRSDEIVEQLPERWHTLLSREFAGGHDLSNGQWQRLAVARGLFRDAALVIWDEPTAPLDAKAEHAVYESLRRIARERTVVLITHRLASVRNADRIFFLERGRLAEQGTHDELIARDGRYAELYRLQTRLHAGSDERRASAAQDAL